MKSVKVKFNSIESVKKFVNISVNQSFDMDIRTGRYIIDGKSILGIFSLDLTKDLVLDLHTDDEDKISSFLRKIKDILCE